MDSKDVKNNTELSNCMHGSGLAHGAACLIGLLAFCVFFARAASGGTVPDPPLDEMRSIAYSGLVISGFIAIAAAVVRAVVIAVTRAGDRVLKMAGECLLPLGLGAIAIVDAAIFVHSNGYWPTAGFVLVFSFCGMLAIGWLENRFCPNDPAV